MLSSVRLSDFQSHDNTELDFGPFTVIVGPSSSGKSALVRALRLVAQNARGTSYVRQGAKTSKVELSVDSRLTVSVERGKSVSSYAVEDGSGSPMVFTKCASSVPDQVADRLGWGDTELWLAGQFDRPFLLDETGAEVARVLGRLTNVTMIYAAVREVNRRASEARRGLTQADQELADVAHSIARYEGLPTRLAAGQAAEEALSCAEELFTRRSALHNRIGDVAEAETRAAQALKNLRDVPSIDRLNKLSGVRERLRSSLSDLTEAEQRCSVSLRPIPDTKKLSSLLHFRVKLKALLDDVTSAEDSVSRLSSHAKDLDVQYTQVKDEFMAALHSAGKCPLCGASSAHAQVDSVL